MNEENNLEVFEFYFIFHYNFIFRNSSSGGILQLWKRKKIWVNSMGKNYKQSITIIKKERKKYENQ